jgi:hypothetical protein
MAMINLDNLTNNLRDRLVVKQDRVIVSGYRATMVMPAVLFHPWRHPSPGSSSESTDSATLKRLIEPSSSPATSRSGCPALSGAPSGLSGQRQSSVGRDRQSPVRRDARLDDPRRASASSRGK